MTQQTYANPGIADPIAATAGHPSETAIRQVFVGLIIVLALGAIDQSIVAAE